MQQIIKRKEEDAMITMEEYLRKKNVIKGKPEAEDGRNDLHSRGKKEKKGEEKGKISAAQWSAMMALAELLYI